VAVVGDFNGFRADTSARAMLRQRDGTWTADVPASADSVAFALLRVAPRGSIAAPGVSRVMRTADGTYRSVRVARGGTARIVFDPGQIVRDSAPELVRYHGGAEARAARTTDSIFAQNVWVARAEQSGAAITKTQFHAVVARLLRELDAEWAPVAREALLFRLLALATLGADVPPRIGRTALRELPPDSPAWFTGPSLAFGLPFAAFRVADSVSHLLRRRSGENIVSPADSLRIRRSAARYAARVDSMAFAAPYDEMVAQTLSFGLAVTNGWLPEQATIYLARLQAEHPEAGATTAALRQWGTLRLLREGVPMPAFRFAALEDTRRVFTNASFTGKAVLVDVWGTWCIPCLHEMPALHEAYAAFKDRGLEILSVSVDETPAAVEQFRRTRWPMPWQHARVVDWMSSPALTALQIHGVPRIVLVGPDGTILAADQDLRGASLQKTLARVLK
jgi:thiol-disulfide isomerase/thioredoxin